MYPELLDLNYDLSSLNWHQLERTSNSKAPGLIEGITRLLYFGTKSILRINPFWGATDVLFLVGTQNNFRAIEPVFNKLSADKKMLFFHSHQARGPRLPEFFFYLAGCLTAFKCLLCYFTEANQYQRWVIRKRLDRYVFGCSSTAIWKLLFKINKTRLVVFSNDHSVWTRSAISAARGLGIKTAFIPHSPTGNNPAPLEYDVAFLDGTIQQSQYQNIGTDIVLCGAIRYENLVVQSSTQEKRSGILVCFNKMDSLDLIENMLSDLGKFFDCRIVVRPHPSDNARHSIIKKLCQKFDFEYSDPSHAIQAYSKDLRFLLAGVSGAHLDGIMMGMTPITLKDWYTDDYYRLEEHGLLIKLETPDKLDKMTVDQSQIQSIRHEYNIHCKRPEQLPSDIVCNKLISILETK